MSLILSGRSKAAHAVRSYMAETGDLDVTDIAETCAEAWVFNGGGVRNMTNLRYVQRQIPDPADNMLMVTEKVLQAWHPFTYPQRENGKTLWGEWRDVPTGIEDGDRE
jgi:hypothetical protein